MELLKLQVWKDYTDWKDKRKVVLTLVRSFNGAVGTDCSSVFAK